MLSVGPTLSVVADSFGFVSFLFLSFVGYYVFPWSRFYIRASSSLRFCLLALAVRTAFGFVCTVAVIFLYRLLPRLSVCSGPVDGQLGPDLFGFGVAVIYFIGYVTLSLELAYPGFDRRLVIEVYDSTSFAILFVWVLASACTENLSLVWFMLPAASLYLSLLGALDLVSSFSNSAHLSHVVAYSIPVWYASWASGLVRSLPDFLYLGLDTLLLVLPWVIHVEVRDRVPVQGFGGRFRFRWFTVFYSSLRFAAKTVWYGILACSGLEKCVSLQSGYVQLWVFLSTVVLVRRVVVEFVMAHSQPRRTIQ